LRPITAQPCISVSSMHAEVFWLWLVYDTGINNHIWFLGHCQVSPEWTVDVWTVRLQLRAASRPQVWRSLLVASLTPWKRPRKPTAGASRSSGSRASISPEKEQMNYTEAGTKWLESFTFVLLHPLFSCFTQTVWSNYDKKRTWLYIYTYIYI